MKTRFLSVIFLIAVVLGTAMSVSARRILSTPAQQAVLEPSTTETTSPIDTAQEVPTVTATSMEHNYTTTRVLQRYTQGDVWTQVANNIEMSVANLKFDSNVVTVYACYQQPDFNNESLSQILDNWVIYQAELEVAGKSFSLGSRKLFEYSKRVSENENLVRINPDFLPDNTVPLEEVTPAGIEYECRRLEFAFDNLDNTLSQQDHVRLIVYSMYAFPREGQLCTFYKLAEKELQTQGKEIMVECVEENGTSNFKITGMNEKDFWEFVWNQFLTYKGPWEFRISLK